MNQKQKRKVIGITGIIFALTLATSLVLYALKQNINLFYTPTELLQTQIHPNQTIRIGGYVKKDSVHFSTSGQEVNFVVTDRKNDITVNYRGMLPNLFREGQVVVVTGKLGSNLSKKGQTPTSNLDVPRSMLAPNTFLATQVLAKHDERYMPKPLAEKLAKGTKHDS